MTSRMEIEPDPEPRADPAAVFDLGGSDAADVARDRDDMVGRAVASRRRPHGSGCLD